MIIDHDVVHVPVAVNYGMLPACKLGDFEDDVTINLHVPSRAPTCLWCATVSYPPRLRYVFQEYWV